MTANLSMDKYVLLQFKSSLREQQRELQQALDRVEKDLRDTVDSAAHSLDLSSATRHGNRWPRRAVTSDIGMHLAHGGMPRCFFHKAGSSRNASLRGDRWRKDYGDDSH